MSINKRKQKIEFLIKSIVNDYLVVDQNLKLLVPLLYDEKIYSKWDGTYAVSGVTAMKYALYTHILSDMRAIMFDPDPKVASMKNVVNALKDNAFCKKLKEDFSTPTGVTVLGDHDDEEKDWLEKTIQKEDITRKIKAFDDTLKSVLEKHHALENSKLGIRINTARSKMISHKQVVTIESERKLYDAEYFGLKFRDAKDIVKQSKDIIFGANLLITRSSFILKGFTNHHKKVSQLFWDKL